MQRQRETGVQQVKAEMDAFKPQLRSFPILILQPDSNEIACGKKVPPPSHLFLSGLEYWCRALVADAIAIQT